MKVAYIVTLQEEDVYSALDGLRATRYKPIPDYHLPIVSDLLIDWNELIDYLIYLIIDITGMEYLEQRDGDFCNNTLLEPITDFREGLETQLRDIPKNVLLFKLVLLSETELAIVSETKEYINV